tara:strand:- start:4169 stop:6106 length:1938 start_codon:yes stop_codon:yes gene_type:complete
MAESDIDVLGESLLAQARQKTKKAKKRATRFSTALLGIGVGNHFLRQRAQRRAENFMASTGTTLLNNRTNQLNQGIKFWDDHNSMVGKYGATGSTDWEKAYRAEQRELYKEQELGRTSQLGKDFTSTELEDFNKLVDSKIEDDVAAYRKKMEAFRNFEYFKDDPDTRKRYLQPVQDKIDEGLRIIKGDSNVGGFLLSNLGLKPRADLETVTVDGVDLSLPFGYRDEDRKAIISNIKTNKIFLDNLSSIEATVKYDPFTPEERADLMKVAKSSTPNSNHVAVLSGATNYKTYKDTQLGTQTFNIAGNEVMFFDIYKGIVNELGAEGAVAFQEDILTVSKRLQEEFEQKNVEGRVVAADTFVIQAVEEVINDRFSVNGETNNQKSGASIVDKMTEVFNAQNDVEVYDRDEVINIAFGNTSYDTTIGKLVDNFARAVRNPDRTKEDNAVMLGILSQSIDDPLILRDLQNLFDNEYQPYVPPSGTMLPFETGRKKKMTFEEIPQEPTESFLTHLKDREGFRNKVYLDSLGKPTAGVGHLLTEEENKTYKVGDVIPDNILDNWLKQDALKAWNAALQQSKDLNVTDLDFIDALASVNFQLGTGWFKIHKNTWKFLKDKRYEEAAKEAADSTWFKQTPVRVKDFQKAIRSL